jgi:hypothetical protein
MGQDVDGACPAFGGAGPQTAILGQPYNEPPENPVIAEPA